ncbi:MAG: hypothetical protein AAB393_01065, partial [Bacteroidota bacterium]
SSRADDPDALLQAKALIQARAGPLALKSVKEISRSLRDGVEFRRMSEFLYCVTGAEIVGADLLLPRCYSSAQAQTTSGPSAPTDLGVEAVTSLFRYFAIDPTQIAQLSPERILQVREDRRVKDAVAELERLIAEAERRRSASPTQASFDELVTEIRTRVREACKRETNRESTFSMVSDIVMDYGIPMSSLFKRGIVRLERWLARSKHFGGATRSFTPLTTFVSLVHVELAEQRRAECSRR